MADMADKQALDWLKDIAESAGKGALNNLDARAVLRAIRQAEQAAAETARREEREACAKIVEHGLLRIGDWGLPKTNADYICPDQRKAFAAAIRARES